MEMIALGSDHFPFEIIRKIAIQEDKVIVHFKNTDRSHTVFKNLNLHDLYRINNRNIAVNYRGDNDNGIAIQKR